MNQRCKIAFGVAVAVVLASLMLIRVLVPDSPSNLERGEGAVSDGSFADDRSISEMDREALERKPLITKEGDRHIPNRAVSRVRSILDGEENFQVKDAYHEIASSLLELQKSPDPEAVDVISELLLDSRTDPTLLTEAMVALLSQENGDAIVSSHFYGSNDRTRAATIRAYGRVRSMVEIEQIVRDLRTNGTNYTGTDTARAILQADFRVFADKYFAGLESTEAKIRFILDRLPYHVLPPPSDPWLENDPTSLFLWNALAGIWTMDKNLVETLLNDYEAQRPLQKRVYEVLRLDLESVDRAEELITLPGASKRGSDERGRP